MCVFISKLRFFNIKVKMICFIVLNHLNISIVHGTKGSPEVHERSVPWTIMHRNLITSLKTFYFQAIIRSEGSIAIVKNFDLDFFINFDTLTPTF